MAPCCCLTTSMVRFIAFHMVRGALQWFGKRMSLGWTVAVVAALLTTRVLAEPPEKLVPCLACHGGSGTSDTENVPALGAQRAPYTLIQLFMFREGLRVAEPMNEFARALSDSDLRLAAGFLAELPPPKSVDGPTEAARFERGRMMAQTYHCLFCHRPDLSGEESV